MGVNLTNEEYAKMILERDAATAGLDKAKRAIGSCRSAITGRTAKNKEERKLLNDVVEIIDNAINSI